MLIPKMVFNVSDGYDEMYLNLPTDDLDKELKTIKEYFGTENLATIIHENPMGLEYKQIGNIRDLNKGLIFMGNLRSNILNYFVNIINTRRDLTLLEILYDTNKRGGKRKVSTLKREVKTENMLPITSILTVTGHRPKDISSELYDMNSRLSQSYIKMFKQYIIKHLELVQGVILCRSGMALGIDTLFAIAVLELREEGHSVYLECCIPCSEHTKAWFDEISIKLYHEIIGKADIVTNVSTEPYTNWCMQDRNVYMVENQCNKLLSIWNKSNGGTRNCVLHAEKVGVSIDVIQPYVNYRLTLDDLEIKTIN